MSDLLWAVRYERLNWEGVEQDTETVVTVLKRLLAALPGGEALEEEGVSPYLVGWREVRWLAAVLAAVQDPSDVAAVAAALLGEDDPDEGV